MSAAAHPSNLPSSDAHWKSRHGAAHGRRRGEGGGVSPVLLVSAIRRAHLRKQELNYAASIF